MKSESPIGITFIGCFKILSALVILFTLNVQQTPPFNIRFAMPFIPELLVRLCVVIFSLIIAYGYLRQNKFGYWSMLIYSILFCCISFFQASKYGNQPFIGNAIYAAIVTVYTLLHRKDFN